MSEKHTPHSPMTRTSAKCAQCKREAVYEWCAVCHKPVGRRCGTYIADGVFVCYDHAPTTAHR